MSVFENLLHARTGPMTTELVQHPADYGLGLGRVPARLAPAGTTNTVCGFCSTGCSLRVHLDAEGQAALKDWRADTVAWSRARGGA